MSARTSATPTWRWQVSLPTQTVTLMISPSAWQAPYDVATDVGAVISGESPEERPGFQTVVSDRLNHQAY